jgi:hypothetical protein
MQHTSPRKRLRYDVCRWIDEAGYTHALTLNSDRELSLAKMRIIFGRFLHELDREVIGKRKVARLSGHLRTRAIAFPENLARNAHLHVAIDLADALAHCGSEAALGRLIYRTWKQSTRGSGTIHLAEFRDGGWSTYMTKDFISLDHPYILSSEFHPA